MPNFNARNSYKNINHTQALILKTQKKKYIRDWIVVFSMRYVLYNKEFLIIILGKANIFS